MGLRERQDQFVNRTSLQLALREVQLAYRSPRFLIGMAVLAAILGYAGPFGTFAELSFAPRLAYWAVIVVVTYAVGLATGLFFVYALKRWMRAPVLVVLTIGFSPARR